MSIFFLRFCNNAQDFASYKILFSKLATNYITCTSLFNIGHDFVSQYFICILRKILQYCKRFCKLQDLIFQNLQQIKVIPPISEQNVSIGVLKRNIIQFYKVS